MGVINKTTAQINSIFRRADTPYVISTGKNSDAADTLTFAGGEINTFKVFPLTMDINIVNGFTVSGGAITYTGSTPANLLFDGSCALGSNQANTLINFRLAKNGSIIATTDSTAKIDATSSINSVNANSIVSATTGDVFTIYAKADKACTISAYHPQIRFKEY